MGLEFMDLELFGLKGFRIIGF